MKHTSWWIGLFSLWAAGVGAVDLNTDAMKKMQQRGHQILDAEQNLRTFRSANGQCLQVGGAPDQVGAGLVSRKCNGKAANQKWRFDDSGRLVSRGDTCVDISGPGKAGSKAVMQQCSGASTQKWRHDDAIRLVNAGGLCLQVNAGNIVAETCADAPAQRWD